MEVSLEGSGLTYQTGDHLAVWPTNADREVDRLLNVLGIADKRHTVIKVTSTDPTTKIPVPTPTTYEAILRFYLEICAPVSRQSLATLAQFAPTDAAKTELTRLGGDKDAFHEAVSSRCLNIGQVMEAVSGGAPWTSVPFSFILETFNHMVPRYCCCRGPNQFPRQGGPLRSYDKLPPRPKVKTTWRTPPSSSWDLVRHSGTSKQV